MMIKTWIKRSFLLGMAFSFVHPATAFAFGEASVIQSYVNRQVAVPLIKPSWGNFILHSESLNKFYSLRSYQALWVDSNGLPNAMAQSLKSILLSADRHGLASTDYWDVEVENLFNSTLKNQNNWITFELAASEALIRYVTHLSVGRFDPELVDADIKFKKKEFNEFAELSNAVLSGPQGLAAALDIFAPTHAHYKDLMDVLVYLKNIKAQGGWGTINSPGFALKRGVKDPVVSQLRARLNQLGYSVSDQGGNVFDQEFEDVLKQYQTKNGLTADGIIGTRSEVLRALNFSVNQRIAQVETTMEKLRWLPKNLETRHILVNLATAEFKLYDEFGQVFQFNTVVGQSFRRTPSMRDLITFVNLNPYWTVPRSIAIKDKLPLLKADRRYLQKHNMLLVDEATDQVVDPSTIDWRNMTARSFTYYIRQLPGPDNALGVVKFPLQNPWAIYMHDTNEKGLFSEGKRHRSSGCVRLEQPLELASYLLKDQPQWSLSDIKSFVPMTAGEQAAELDVKVFLKKPMSVYFLYLTVERSPEGSIRFIDDVYGQDARLNKALANKKNPGELF